MFLSNEAFEEINQIFKPPEPLDIIDKDGEIKKMDSLYELEDYIKENIYDKKYPGLLPNIDTNLLSMEKYSNEDDEESQDNNSQNNLKEENIDIDKNIKEKKYKLISRPTDIIITENYSTDDEDEFNAVNLLNEDRNEGNEYGWTLAIEKDKTKIYYKIIKINDDNGKEIDSIVFYVESTIDFSSTKVNQYVNDFEFRKEFDSLYEKGKIISDKNEEGIKIIDLYLYLKMPFVFTDRDFVVRKKIWNNYNNQKDSFLIHIKSIDDYDSEYPPKDKPVRGIFVNRAAYICPIDDGHSKFYLYTCFDMKMNVGVSMMKQKGSEGQGQWVDKFINNIKKHEE